MEKPTKEDLENAMDTCFDYASYLKETEPYATNSITILENAADELSASVTYYDDNCEEDENTNRESSD